MKKNITILVLSLILLSLLGILFTRNNTETNGITPDQALKENSDSATIQVSKNNTLDLSNQNLDKLPESVLSKTSLEELNISDNKLTGALPAEIRQLKSLRILNASNNLMTGVPAEIGQLSNLEVLDLSNNKLTGLPYELGNLKKLKTLNLSGNDYSKQDLEIIKKSLPSTTNIIL